MRNPLNDADLRKIEFDLSESETEGLKVDVQREVFAEVLRLRAQVGRVESLLEGVLWHQWIPRAILRRALDGRVDA